MRKALAVLAVIATLAITPNAFAYDCNNRYVYLTGVWEYIGNDLASSDSTCWSITHSTPSWNSTAGEWDFFYTYPTTSAVRVVSVPSGDSGSTNWEAAMAVDFYDPHASSFEYLSGVVDVNHGGTHTQHTFYANNGGVLSSDSGYKYVDFSAQSGDTITVTITGQNAYNDSYVRFAGVHLFRFA
jgi:hypothetical protein